MDGQLVGQLLTLGLAARGGRGAAAPEGEIAATSRLTPRVNVADEFTVRVRADGSRRYSYGRADRGHGLDMAVDADGVLGLDVRSSGRGASGTDMVLSGMQRLEADGVQVSAIRGNWLRSSDSVNYREFMVNLDRMTPQQAAANTWTGRLAARLGYTDISTPEIRTSPVVGLPNTPYQVVVLFRRPPNGH